MSRGRINTLEERSAIGPPRGLVAVTTAELGAGGYTNEQAGEFFVECVSAGNIVVETSHGDQVTFNGVAAGDILKAAGLPLLCSKVVKTGTTVTSFKAVFLG